MRALIFETKTGKVKFKTVSKKRLPEGYEKNIACNNSVVYIIKDGKRSVAVNQAKWEDESGRPVSSIAKNSKQGGCLNAALSAVVFLITSVALDLIYIIIFDRLAPIIMVLACSTALTYGISTWFKNKF